MLGVEAACAEVRGEHLKFHAPDVVPIGCAVDPEVSCYLGKESGALDAHLAPERPDDRLLERKTGSFATGARPVMDQVELPDATIADKLARRSELRSKEAVGKVLWFERVVLAETHRDAERLEAEAGWIFKVAPLGAVEEGVDRPCRHVGPSPIAADSDSLGEIELVLSEGDEAAILLPLPDVIQVLGGSEGHFGRHSYSSIVVDNEKWAQVPGRN